MHTPDRLHERPRTVASLLVVLILLPLGGCNTFDTLIKEQNSRINSLQTQLGELEGKRVEMIQQQAVEREGALTAVHNAKMEQVKSMTNYVWAIDQTNARNPVENNHKILIDQYAQLSLAASPERPAAEFQNLYREKYQPLEAATVSRQQIEDVLTRTEFLNVTQQVQATAVKKEDFNRLTQEQQKQLGDIEALIDAKRGELISVTRKAYDATRVQLEREQDTAKFYQQMVWLFGGCAALAVVGAFFCGYTGNVRMAAYCGLAAAAFAGCAYLTIWLSENRWVLWVVFGGGVVCVAGVVFMRYGWGVRNTQLVGFAAKRATLVRYITVDLKKTLQDFGLATGEDINSLDLHEVEKLQDDLLAYLKNQGLPLPEFLKS